MKRWIPALAICGFLCGAASAGDLDVRGWLDRPGTRLLAVEFYATWCAPCMKAVPKWKALHEKYRSKGLRLVVVSTLDPDGGCVNPGWLPDETVCDPEGLIAEAFGLGGKLPAAFLWSWQGNLLVGRGHVEEIERAVEQHLAHNPRVLVEVAPGGSAGVALRDLVREQLSSRGKLELVVSEAEARALAELKADSFRARFDDRLQCEIGKEVPANSLLRVTVDAGKRPRLGLLLFSAESGCLLAAATVPWQKEEPRRAVAEAVDELLVRLRSEPQLPGAVERPAARKAADAKRQAQLWVEYAQSPLCIYGEETQKAYDKAIALDPELAAAYLGRADVRNKDWGTDAWECDAQARQSGELPDPECLKKLAAEVQRITEGPLADVDRAIALDDGNAEAYAKRVEVLSRLREYHWAMDVDAKPLDARILEDANRAIALGSVAKPFLYEQRAIVHDRSGKPDRALADMTQAIGAKEVERPDAEYGGAKVLGQYYLARADLHRGPDREEKAKKDRQKAVALFEEEKKKREDEQRAEAALLENSEIGKLIHELEIGPLERVSGVSIKSLEHWGTPPGPLQQQVMAKIAERIKAGRATPEEYLFMGGQYAGGEEAARERYLDEGIRRLKPESADPVKAMRLVRALSRRAAAELYPEERFDAALKTLDEARAVIDRFHPRARSDLADLMKKRAGPPDRELMDKVTRLSREDALALLWWQEALDVGRERVRIYEKLGLSSKARAEHRTLCDLLDEDACRSLERLK